SLPTRRSSDLRIRDRFGPVVREKVEKYGSKVVGQTFATDDKEMIRDQIRAFVDQGVDMVLVTSGMSVDPDDRTPGAIASLEAEIVTYGTPILRSEEHTSELQSRENLV